MPGLRIRFSLTVTVLMVTSAALVGSATAGHLQRLTQSSAADLHPTWSLDDQYIVFESNRSSPGTYHLFRIPVSGGEPEQLTSGPASDIHPEYSPDGSEIAYARETKLPDGSLVSSALQVMEADGTNPRVMVSVDLDILWHPSWHPDGTILYYTRGFKGSGGWGIFRMPAAGGNPEEIGDFGVQLYTNVSPDGSSMLYTYAPDRHSAYNIVQSPLSNLSEREFLTHDTQNTAQAAYSPDGRKMAYVSRRLGGRLELFEYDFEAGKTTRLTFDRDAAFDPTTQFPAYSHDGTRIAFSSRRVTGDHNIWILTPGASHETVMELRVGSGQGLPGGLPVHLPVSLQNEVSVAALEFRLSDIPDHLALRSVSTRDRGATMEVTHQDREGAHILVYSAEGKLIPSGDGAILDLEFDFRQSASEGDEIALNLHDVVVADPNGNAVVVITRDGSVVLRRIPGDLNGDNRIDVGDLVRLIEIIMDIGRSPSPEELDLADCNGDEAWNALDTVCLVQQIFDTETPSGPQTAAPSGWTLSTSEPVRGIQMRFAHDAPPLEDLESLALRRSPTGRTTLAFDARGQELAAGVTIPFVSEMPVEVRAYGAGGSPVPVTVAGDRIEIGRPISAGVRILGAQPNPFRAGTVIHFTTGSEGIAQASIFDVRGALVSRIPSTPVSAGRHAWSWSARSLTGQPLPAGIYLGVVETETDRATVRLTHLGN